MGKGKRKRKSKKYRGQTKLAEYFITEPKKEAKNVISLLDSEEKIPQQDEKEEFIEGLYVTDYRVQGKAEKKWKRHLKKRRVESITRLSKKGDIVLKNEYSDDSSNLDLDFSSDKSDENGLQRKGDRGQVIVDEDEEFQSLIDDDDAEEEAVSKIAREKIRKLFRTSNYWVCLPDALVSLRKEGWSGIESTDFYRGYFRSVLQILESVGLNNNSTARTNSLDLFKAICKQEIRLEKRDNARDHLRIKCLMCNTKRKCDTEVLHRTKGQIGMLASACAKRTRAIMDIVRTLYSYSNRNDLDLDKACLHLIDLRNRAEGCHINTSSGWN